MYFPDALAAVAQVSKVGNDQHNPGEPLHWARGKSMDQLNTAFRHMIDHGTGNVYDDGGKTRHLAKAAWRILAELQLSIEDEEKSRIVSDCNAATPKHTGTKAVCRQPAKISRSRKGVLPKKSRY